MKPLGTILNDMNIISSNIHSIKKIKRNVQVDVNNDLIIQHNELIEAHYRLSLQEKRVILWLLTQIKSDDEDFKLHKLEITAFAKMIGLGADNQYSKLQEVTLNLMKRVVKINKPENKSVLQIAWLSYAEYYFTKGYIKLRFDPALKPYLLQLKNRFTKITLSDIMQLTSIYAMRFYELLKQYEFIGKRIISIKELREYCGIVQQEYKRYSDFKKDVLERGKKEINEKSDLEICYKEIKESRKITSIEWTVRKKDSEKQKHLDRINRLGKELRSEHVIIDDLLEYGFSKMIAKRLIKLNGEETLKNAIRAVDLQVARGKAKNPKAMLMAAIKEKWHPEIFKNKKSTHF